MNSSEVFDLIATRLYPSLSDFFFILAFPFNFRQVFASDAVGNCSNENSQTILFRGTADVFSAGVAFENKLPFSCYGLKVQSQSEEGYVAVKMLMFGNNLKGRIY